MSDFCWKSLNDAFETIEWDVSKLKGPFFLFAYDDYYPGGGMSDYKGAFPAIDDALQVVRDSAFGHYDNISLVAIVDGELTWIGAINPTGNVHFEPLSDMLSIRTYWVDATNTPGWEDGWAEYPGGMCKPTGISREKR